jgi:2,3-bisphosphoglycerate-independent phosphoglycerate mutase
VNHIVAAAKAITDAGVPVALHAVTDGRDVAPKSAFTYISELEERLPEGARIVTVCGRYFAMDRDNRWERVSLAYGAITHGTGNIYSSVDAAISSAYNNETTDEFIRPVIIDEHAGLQDGDGLFFINFRADRAREILRAIGEPGFDEFDVGTRPTLSALLGMVEYSDAHNGYMSTCFPKRDIVNTLAEWVAKHGKTQFHTAETEKYPHVTFFLNGGKEDPVKGETRYMAASPKVATYDLQPEMSAPDVTEHFVHAIHDGFDLIVTNFANPDMVGHTGDLDAAIAACEAVDEGLGKVIAALEQVGGAMIVTADHGNCETMWDDATNGPHTAHTTNPVPVVLMGGPDGCALAHGRRAELAPTVLELMGVEKPAEMTGESLIRS